MNSNLEKAPQRGAFSRLWGMEEGEGPFFVMGDGVTGRAFLELISSLLQEY
jgi:hypothetical protein